MAFRLNLYHERQKEAQERARDPLKLASLAGIAIGIFMLLYYGFQWMSVRETEQRARNLREQWAQKEPELKRAEAMEVELLAAQKTNAALMARLQSRFYWAPFLDRITEVVPPEVQIQRMECAGEGAGMKSMTLLGLAAGNQPRSVAENFRRSLQAKLSEHYDAVTVVYAGNDSLTEINESVTLGGESLPVARFSFKVGFKPKAAVAEENQEGAKS